jgi:hypothetical protein
LAMSSKSGQRITGRRASGSTRTTAKTDGAFGKEQVGQTASRTEQDRDGSEEKTRKAGR